MTNKTIFSLLTMGLVAFSLVSCGVSEDVHEAVVAENQAAQASVIQLTQETESLKSDLAKAQATVKDLNDLYPPKRFKDRNEIESWLRNDDISDRGLASLAEGWLSKALEQQSRLLSDGYIVSADYYGPDEDGAFEVWLSAVTEDLDYFMWDPEFDEVFFITNTNLLE